VDARDFDAVLTAVREFVAAEVVPAEQQIDETDEVPARIRERAAAMGLFGFALPEEFGGLGLTMTEEVRLAFEIGVTTPAFRSMFATNNGLAGQVIVWNGTAGQQERYLPAIARGDIIASFALTEPEAGSDPGGLTTSARRDGDSWIIEGAKRYITNAPVADLFVVFARTADGGPQSISAFLVDRDTPGLWVGPRDKKMGQAGAWTGEVGFDGARVPAAALLGEREGTGFTTAMRSLSRGRLHIAAVCVGLAQRLLMESASYAGRRHQFGQAIGQFQLVQGMLADSQTECYAGRAMVLEAARHFDDGTDTRVGPSCCKYFCSEMAGRVADRAVQIFGGAGYMRGVAVERFYRDARVFRLYEGTSQVQQVIIARQVLRSGPLAL